MRKTKRGRKNKGVKTIVEEEPLPMSMSFKVPKGTDYNDFLNKECVDKNGNVIKGLFYRDVIKNMTITDGSETTEVYRNEKNIELEETVVREIADMCLKLWCLVHIEHNYYVHNKNYIDLQKTRMTIVEYIKETFPKNIVDKITLIFNIEKDENKYVNEYKKFYHTIDKIVYYDSQGILNKSQSLWDNIDETMKKYTADFEPHYYFLKDSCPYFPFIS